MNKERKKYEKEKITDCNHCRIDITHHNLIKNIAFRIWHRVHNLWYDRRKSNSRIRRPKLSFLKKENDRSYSYKNIRGNKILKKEVNDFLNTLEKTKCNNTTYYYDKENDFTIIEYSVKNNVLYNTISYQIRYGDYCHQQESSKISEKLGGLARLHTMNGEGIELSPDKEFVPRLVVTFLDSYDKETKKYQAELTAYYLTESKEGWDKLQGKTLEKSTGTFEIKEDKLYYTRTETSEKSSDITIPEVSVFEIENKELKLIDNYLSTYADEVILK